ncbi:MAG: choice-of-anchor Q domain-containing protein [Bdellovibrio sp.]
MKTTILFLLMLLCSSAYSANWYVDNALAVSGAGNSWATAFNSFESISWSKIQPGDTLFISGGTTSKTYTSTLNIGADGTESSKILIRVGQDQGHNGMVILDSGGISIAYVNNVTIDGSIGSASHMLIQNVTDASKDWGWAVNDAGSGGVGITVRYLTITNCNNGINLTYADTFEVDHNSITVKGDAGIRAFGGPTHGFGWNKVHDNSITSLGKQAYGGPDSIQSGNSIDIYNNQFFAVESNDALQGQHPDSLQMGGGRYVRVYGNTFLNVSDSNIDYDAVGQGMIQDIYIYNNLFHITQTIDAYPDFIRMYSTGLAINTFSNVKIFNNTFIDDKGGVRMIGFDFHNGTGAGEGNEMRNNLAKGPTPMNFNIGSGGGSFTINLSNNIYPSAQDNDPTAIIGVPILDANFVPSASDTLARDRGMTLNYFSTDKLGTPRPQGSAWDIGAFEYSANAPLKLAAPMNLRIQ